MHLLRFSVSTQSGATTRLRAGDIVEVKSIAQIAETLDHNGTLDGLPFMSEMAPYCGHRFSVLKRATKTCEGGLRKLDSMVYLTGLRCTGTAHAHCAEGCLLYWKEAWLNKVGGKNCDHTIPRAEANLDTGLVQPATVTPETAFTCQATELKRMGVPLRRRDLRQYIEDIQNRNVRWRDLRDGISFCWSVLYWQLFHLLHEPVSSGTKSLEERSLMLMPGELVRVRSKSDVLRTLDAKRRHRGLQFFPDMLRFCGKEYRVLRHVNQVIEPSTGALRPVRDCVILEGVTCSGRCMFCPRAEYYFWREIWLERV